MEEGCVGGRPASFPTPPRTPKTVREKAGGGRVVLMAPTVTTSCTSAEPQSGGDRGGRKGGREVNVNLIVGSTHDSSEIVARSSHSSIFSLPFQSAPSQSKTSTNISPDHLSHQNNQLQHWTKEKEERNEHSCRASAEPAVPQRSGALGLGNFKGNPQSVFSRLLLHSGAKQGAPRTTMDAALWMPSQCVAVMVAGGAFGESGDSAGRQKLQTGSRVRIEGLASQPEFNGLEGTVKKLLPNERVWVITVRLCDSCLSSCVLPCCIACDNTGGRLLQDTGKALNVTLAKAHRLETPPSTLVLSKMGKQHTAAALRIQRVFRGHMGRALVREVLLDMYSSYQTDYAPADTAAAPDWQELYSDEYQATYWWNEATGETTWDKPQSPPGTHFTCFCFPSTKAQILTLRNLRRLQRLQTRCCTRACLCHAYVC